MAESCENSEKSEAAKRIGADDEVIEIIASEVMGIDSEFYSDGDDKDDEKQGE